MRCPNCGTKNKDGMKFCKICGCQLPTNTDTFEDNDTRRNTPKWLIVAIIVVVAAIIGVVAFFLISQFWDQTNDDSEEIDTPVSVTETSNMDSSAEESTIAVTTEATTQVTTEALRIPNVVGLKSNDAYVKISDLNLKYKAEFEYSDSIPEDYVISQSPSEDKEANIGDAVTLKISRGKKPASSNNSSDSSVSEKSSTDVSSYSDTTDRYGLNASSRYISRSDISWMSLDEIQMAINEIYAKLGFRFNKPPYKDYFESKDWYHPDTQDMNVIEKRMNKYEFENMKVMGTYRDSLSN